MDITVTPEGAPDPPPTFASEPIVAPAPSPLDGLKAKLAEASSKLYKDFEVPRWADLMGLRVFVRMTPLDPSYASTVADKYAKTKAEDWGAQANAQMIAHCCTGVYAVDPERPDVTLSLRPGDPDGTWTKIDHELAETIGAPSLQQGGSLITTCRRLFFTEGDLTAMAGALAEWSAQSAEEAQRDFQAPSGATTG